MNSWSEVIIEWANCLGVVESSIRSLQDLQDGAFYETLVSQLCRGHEESFNDIAIESDEQLVSKFLRAEYPHFEDDDSLENGCRDLYTASLFLLQCAQQPVFHRPMCVALKQETQVQIKRFLEVVLPCGKNLTKRSIESAIKELEVRSSPGQTRLTPRGRPLREFFNSPAVKSARSQRSMNERNRELMCLRAQLETEQYEKADLAEDLKIQSEKVSNLQKKLEEKTKELRDLRNDRLRPPTPQSCRKSKTSSESVTEERYRRHAEDLETRNSQLVSELEKVCGEREDLALRLSLSEKSSETMREKLKIAEKSVESLVHELETKNNEIYALRVNGEELREHIRQTKRLPFADQSFDAEPAFDEALSSIVDLQLQEARKESLHLRNELAETKVALENSLRESRRLPELESLVEQVRRELESARTALELKEEQLLGRETEVAALDRERSELSEEVKSLRDSLREKIQLFTLNQSELEVARSKIHDLTDALESAESKTIEFSLLVQDARQKLENTESLLISRDEKLSILGEEKKHLECLLSDTKGELRDISACLENEKISVKKLEFIVKSSNEQSEALRKDLTLSNDRLLLVNDERKILESTLRSTLEKLEKTQTFLDKESTRSAALETTLSHANRDLMTLKNSLQSRDEEFEQERRKVGEFESIVERSKEEHRDLATRIDRVTATLHAERAEADGLRKIIEDSEKSREDLEVLVKSKEKLLENSQEREKSCKAKINELSDSLRFEVAKSRDLETKLSQEIDKFLELEVLIKSREKLLEDSQDREKSCKAKINELSDSLRVEVAKCREFETKLSQENDKFVELETLLKSKEKLLEVSEDRENFLRAEMKSCEGKINELSDSLRFEVAKCREFETKLSQENEKFLELETLLRSKEKLLEDSEDRENSLRGEMKSCEAKINELNDSLRVEVAKCREFETKLCRESDKFLKLEASLRQTETKKKRIEKDLSAAIETIKRIESELADAKTEISSLEDQQKWSNSANDELQEKVKVGAEKMLHMESKIYNSEALNEKLDRSLMEKTDKVNELQNELNEKSTCLDSVQRLLEESEMSKTRMAEESKKLERRIAELTELGQEMESQMEQERKRSRDLCDEVEKLEDRLSVSEGRNNDLAAKFEILDKELYATREKLLKETALGVELNETLKEFRTTNLELEEKLEITKNQVTSLRSQWEKSQAELTSRVNEISVFQQNIDSLTRELEESQENYRKMSLETERVRKDLDAERTRNRELEENLEITKNQVTSLRIESEESQAELTSRVNEVSVFQQNIESLTRELEESRENDRQTSLETEKVRKDLNVSLAMNRELEEKCESQRIELETMKIEKNNLQEKLSSLASETSELKLEIEKLQHELAESRENYQKQLLKSEEISKDLNVSLAKNQRLEEKLSLRKQEIETLSSHWDESKKELVSHVSKISALELDMEKISSELAESQENFQKESLKNERVRKDLDVSLATNRELEEKCESQIIKLETLKTEENNLQEKLSSLAIETSELKLEIEKLENTLTESQENYKKQSLKNEEISKDLDVSLAMNRQLEKKCESQKIELETLTSEKNNLQEKLSILGAESSELKLETEKLEHELKKYVSELEKEKVSNAILSEKEIESEESLKSLKLQMAEKHERLKTLESEKTALEQELSSCALLEVEKAEEIESLKKTMESSREDYRIVLEKQAEERARLEQRLEQSNEKLKSHSEEIDSLRKELESVKMEREGLTEKIQETRHIVTVLEKRLVVAENLRTETELEGKLKKEALNVVHAKLEQMGKEKIESELRMKEIIVNLQQVRESQDQVMEAQTKALDEKSHQQENLEKELQDLRILLGDEKSRGQEILGDLKKLEETIAEKSRQQENLERELEELRISLADEKSRGQERVEDLKKLEATIAEKSGLVEKLESSLDSERRSLREAEQSLEGLKERMTEMGKLSQDLRLELNCLWDSVRQTCPELARSSHEPEEDARKLLESFVEDTKAVRKVVSILSEANETLKEHASSEKESARIMFQGMEKEKLGLGERLEFVENELEDRHRRVCLLEGRNHELRKLLQRIVCEKEKVKEELVHLINRWSLLNIEADDFLSSAIIDREELKCLVSQRNAIESSLINFNERHVSNSKGLLQALDRIFCSPDPDRAAPLVGIEKNDLAGGTLSEEMERDELMKRDLASLGKKMSEFSESLKSYDAKLRAGLLRDSAESEKKLRAELERISKEKKEIREKLNTARARSAKMEKNMDELRNNSKKVKSELSEELEKLRALTEKLEQEKTELSKRIEEKTDVETLHKEYGQKLEKIKQKMKTAYNEQIAKLNQEQEKILKGKMETLKIQTEQQCRKYAEDIAKYKAHISDLSSRYWDVGEKLLAESQEKQVALQQVQKLKELRQHHEGHAEIKEQVVHSRQKTASLDRREFSIDRLAREPAARVGYGAVEVIEEETTTFSTHRRHSVKSIQAMGNAFRAEDEEGEVFDSVYLADLKEGRCAPTGPDLDRLSELRMRNSMCRPHLKSSYAVETNLQPIALHEDDIKNGVTGEDVFNDSLSQSLLPGQKAKKKDRTQTSYKRPGPPTPSKNGGRLSLQGNELKSPNSRILKERNVERRTTATPRGLKNLFGTSMSKRQDENTLGTPKGRRLSNIFRKQRTERN